jgi:hypothetical protein
MSSLVSYDPEKDSPVRTLDAYKHSFRAILYALENAKLYTDDNRSADVWDYVGTDSNNVQMYTMKAHIMEQRNVQGRVAVRGTCMVKAPAHIVANALLNGPREFKDPLEARKQWDPSLIAYRVLNSFDGKYALAGLCKYQSPSWLFTDRDFAWLRDARVNVDDQGNLTSFYLCGTSLSDKDTDIKCPLDSSAVRGEIFVSSWVIKPFNEQQCRLEIVADVDLCVTAWMPESVHKWISSDNIESLVRMKRIAESKT